MGGRVVTGAVDQILPCEQCVWGWGGEVLCCLNRSLGCYSLLSISLSLSLHDHHRLAKMEDLTLAPLSPRQLQQHQQQQALQQQGGFASSSPITIGLPRPRAAAAAAAAPPSASSSAAGPNSIKPGTLRHKFRADGVQPLEPALSTIGSGGSAASGSGAEGLIGASWPGNQARSSSSGSQQQLGEESGGASSGAEEVQWRPPSLRAPSPLGVASADAADGEGSSPSVGSPTAGLAVRPLDGWPHASVVGFEVVSSGGKGVAVYIVNAGDDSSDWTVNRR